MIHFCEPPLPAGLAVALDSSTSVLELKVCGPASRAALQAYIEGATPPLPTDEDVDTIVAGLAVALPRKQNDGAAAEAKLEIYAQALADIPMVDLQAASDLLIKTARFFPTVAEIRKAALVTMGPRHSRIARARLMILRHDREWVAPDEPMSAAEAHRAAKIMSDPLAKRARQ